MEDTLRDVIRNMTRDNERMLPSSLFLMIHQYYGFGDLLIVYMDRIQMYNLVSPSSINLHAPIQINESCSTSGIVNAFTFRCSVVHRGYDTNDILFIGGFDEQKGVAVTECQLYSMHNHQLQTIFPCSDPRSDARSVMLNEFECITMGGHQVEAIDSVEMYSFKTHQWQSFPSLPSKNVYFASAAARRLGKVFVAGGQDSYGVFNTCWVLENLTEDIDATTNESDSKRSLRRAEDAEAEKHWKWTPLKNMMRYNYWCEGLYNDRYDEFLVLGGLRRNRNVDLYDVAKNQWSGLPPSKYDHYNGVCAFWNEHLVWIGDDRKMCSMELFDRRTNQWISKEIPSDLQPPSNKARIWKWI